MIAKRFRVARINDQPLGYRSSSMLPEIIRHIVTVLHHSTVPCTCQAKITDSRYRRVLS